MSRRNGGTGTVCYRLQNSDKHASLTLWMFHFLICFVLVWVQTLQNSVFTFSTKPFHLGSRLVMYEILIHTVRYWLRADCADFVKMYRVVCSRQVKAKTAVWQKYLDVVLIWRKNKTKQENKSIFQHYLHKDVLRRDPPCRFWILAVLLKLMAFLKGTSVFSKLKKLHCTGHLCRQLITTQIDCMFIVRW